MEKKIHRGLTFPSKKIRMGENKKKGEEKNRKDTHVKKNISQILPMVDRDFSSSARILLSCSILAIMRSISVAAFSRLADPVSGEALGKPPRPLPTPTPPPPPPTPEATKEEEVLVVYTPEDESELREVRPAGGRPRRTQSQSG